MTFSETPSALHARVPSEESRSTRVTEAVPWCSSRIRTLKFVSSTSAICGCCSVIAAAERAVERVDRPVALGRPDVALARRPRA